MTNAIKQVVVVTKTANPDQVFEETAFFNPDGTQYEGLPTDASGVDFTPTGTVAATDVQAAIAEVASEATSGIAAAKVLSAVTVATAIGTADKTTASAEPTAGHLVLIKFTNGNSANSPTVAFNGGTARAIKLGGTAVTGAKCTVAADGVIMCWFDGTDLHQIGEYV